MIENSISIRERQFPHNPNRWALRAGNKTLFVWFSVFGATTYIKNVRGAEPMTGATTALYRRAKEIMQEEAHRLGRSIYYRYRTHVPSMKRWAETKGFEVFGWRQGDMRGENEYLDIQVKVLPKSKK